MIKNNNYKCEFCDKNFSSQSNLTTHKRTSQYCLNIQKEKIPRDKIKIREFRCELCNNLFINKNSLLQHTVLCKSENEQRIIVNNMKNEINVLHQKIEDLKNEIKKKIWKTQN